MRVHLRTDVAIDHFSNEEIVLRFPHTTAHWKNPPEILQKRLKRLVEYGSEDLYEEELDELPSLFYLLETLKKSSFLSYTIMEGDKPLVTLTPHHNGTFEFKEKKLDPDHPLQISRFVFLRRENDHFVIESPLLTATVVLNQPEALAFFYALSSPKNIHTLTLEFSHLSKETVIHLFKLFHQANLLSDSDQDTALTCWEFHDLLFHTKSRHRGDHRVGTTYRFLNQMAPEQALREVPVVVIPLLKPDLDHLIKSDPTFTEVMENRKSIRKHGNMPISKDQLSEFLYRVAHVKGVQKALHYEATIRSYPGGGACYELELYPLIHHCSGLDRGLYRYHPDIHALCPCSIDQQEMENLLRSAHVATRKTEHPQVLILIAARFKRVSWKYESMAYALILKNTGVLIQTMYLTATAMKLAPCAVGAGNSDHFANGTKINYYEETTVGEFILGTQ